MDEIKKKIIEDAKEIKDIHNYMQELDLYYKNNMFDKVNELVTVIMLKYHNETVSWNSYNTNMPKNNHEYYINAMNFLNALAEEKKNEKLFNFKAIYGEHIYLIHNWLK